MTKRKIYVTRYDLKRLRALIDVRSGPEAPYLEKLKKELQRAVVKEPDRIPGDVVTMNSTVRAREETFPRGISARDGEISLPYLKARASFCCNIKRGRI